MDTIAYIIDRSNTMRLSIPAMFLFLLFTFNVLCTVQKGSFINKDAVLASGSSATIVSLNLTLDIHVFDIFSLVV